MIVNLVILINLVNILVPTGAFNCDIVPRNSDGRIKKKILCDYDKYSPPPSLVTNKENNVILEIRPKVVNVRSYSQAIHISTKTVLYYTDERLMWDPADFDQKDSLIIDSTDIWIPNFSQFSEYEGEDDISDVHCSDTKCNILAAGHITCLLPCEYYGHCDLDYYNWPYAFGNCSLSIGNTDENHQAVSFYAIQSKEIDLLTTDNEFQLISASCGPVYENKNNKIKYHIKCVYKFIKYTVVEIAEVLPPLITNSFVSILVLLIDARKAERILLSVICMLMQLYITGLISFELNEFNEEGIPKIGQFLASILSKTTLLAALTIFETTLIRSMMDFTYDVPYWMKVFLSKVNKNPLTELLFIKSYIISKVRKKSEANGVNTITVEIRNNSTNWETFAKIIDRFFSFIMIGLYAILWFKFGPSSKMVEQFRSESQRIPN